MAKENPYINITSWLESQRPEEPDGEPIRKIARANILGEAFRILNDGIYGSRGATIQRREPVGGYTQALSELNHQYQGDLSQWQDKMRGAMERGIDYNVQQTRLDRANKERQRDREARIKMNDDDNKRMLEQQEMRDKAAAERAAVNRAYSKKTNKPNNNGWQTDSSLMPLLNKQTGEQILIKRAHIPTILTEMSKDPGIKKEYDAMSLQYGPENNKWAAEQLVYRHWERYKDLIYSIQEGIIPPNEHWKSKQQPENTYGNRFAPPQTQKRGYQPGDGVRSYNPGGQPQTQGQSEYSAPTQNEREVFEKIDQVIDLDVPKSQKGDLIYSLFIDMGYSHDEAMSTTTEIINSL